MGSFNATCIVSGLPIEAGTPVRFLALTENAYHRGNEHVCYVTGRWQLRCPPVRALYNDYGSVEKIKKGLTTRVFFESFDRDVVEKGVGDNQCHDVQVRPGMKQKGWLEALWEGRVFVLDRPRREDPKLVAFTKKINKHDDCEAVGLPTLARMEKLLADAGKTVVTDWGAEGYVLDQPSRGFIRIRWGQHSQETTLLDLLVPLLTGAGYAAMVTAGTGMYANKAEVLVAPTPAVEHAFTSGVAPKEDHDQPRPVSQAMIREDVWQLMLATPAEDFREFTLEKLKADAAKAVEGELAYQKSRRDFEGLSVEERKTKLDFQRDADFLHRETREDFNNAFWAGLHGAEGVSGFSLKQSFNLAVELHKTPEELQAFVADLVETIYCQWVYGTLHGQWSPSTNSGQEGHWDLHRGWFEKLAKIRGAWEDE